VITNQFCLIKPYFVVNCLICAATCWWIVFPFNLQLHPFWSATGWSRTSISSFSSLHCVASSLQVLQVYSCSIWLYNMYCAINGSALHQYNSTHGQAKWSWYYPYEWHSSVIVTWH